MALPKIQDVRDLDNQALDQAIADTRRKLFDLRFQQATRQLQTGLHQFKHERHRLAQLMTVLRERQLAEEASTMAKSDAPPAAAAASSAVSAAEEE
ncbi:50S ribosomal protein L29 [Leptolyngbya iicbica]|uniref:Large ribosomal subunit protein uL29 n=2 Tax=Cyanophyceae TaxID=3028117 RepID=A0A4V2E2Q4_9CYAN|nr:50S ribosomal protein L29 [Leptolyngbya sp. LK]RZM79366.1 50S ribosomal protein L29 [Leptolyngbya sp. LK]